MAQDARTLRIALRRRVLWGRALRDGAIGLTVLAFGFLMIAPGLLAGQDLNAFDLLWRWLFFGGIFAVGAIEAVRVARLTGCVFEIGPAGLIDRRIQHRIVPWDRLERADWLDIDGKAAVLSLWPSGPIELYRTSAPLWGYFGLIDWLRKTAKRSGFEFGPLNVDLASLDAEPERIREAIRFYWGEPTARPLVPSPQSDRPS